MQVYYFEDLVDGMVYDNVTFINEKLAHDYITARGAEKGTLGYYTYEGERVARLRCANVMVG